MDKLLYPHRESENDFFYYFKNLEQGVKSLVFQISTNLSEKSSDILQDE